MMMVMVMVTVSVMILMIYDGWWMMDDEDDDDDGGGGCGGGGVDDDDVEYELLMLRSAFPRINLSSKNIVHLLLLPPLPLRFSTTPCRCFLPPSSHLPCPSLGIIVVCRRSTLTDHHWRNAHRHHLVPPLAPTMDNSRHRGSSATTCRRPSE